MDDIDIEIAVVVVVEQRDARRQDLRIEKLSRCAVEVDEVEAGFSRAIDEPVSLTRRRAGHRIARGLAVRLASLAVPARDEHDGRDDEGGWPGHTLLIRADRRLSF